MPVKKRTMKAKKPPAKVKTPKPVGLVTHFYNKISVGIVKVKSPIKVGDTLKFKGKHGEFTQALDSMQFQHEPITKAPKGKEVGIKVDQPVHENDLVYLA